MNLPSGPGAIVAILVLIVTVVLMVTSGPSIELGLIAGLAVARLT